jgi:Secretion system C-terminal sorting domain
MKKFTLSILLSAVAFCSYAQVKDTVFSENKVNGIWAKNGIDIQTLNASCDVSSNLFQVWDEGTQSYINAALTTYAFDNTGTVTGALTQNWDAANSVWINNSKASYTFSDDGLHFTNIVQAWDATTNTWINNYRILAEYNPDGTTRASEFDLSDGINWLPQARNFNAYDDQKRVIEFLYQVYTNNVWVNNSRAVNDYSGKGLSFSYYWDAYNNQWIKAQRSFNKYLSTTVLPTKTLYQSYTGINWQNQSRYATEYNDANMLTRNKGDFWDAALKNWYNGFHAATDYYDDGSQRSFIFESWDVNSSSWSFGYRATYTNNACGTMLEFTPPAEVSNSKANIFDVSRYGINHAFQSSNAGNKTGRYFNMQMSNGKASVYDFNYTSGQKQFAFSLVRKSMMKPRAAKAETGSNIVLQGKNKVLISPNPAKNYFALDLSSYKTQGSVILKLTDLSGKHIMQQKVQAGSVQNISLPYLQTGMYLVTIIAGKEIHTQKLMVQ